MKFIGMAEKIRQEIQFESLETNDLLDFERFPQLKSKVLKKYSSSRQITDNN